MSPPGNSTVNMASVVPYARVVEPTQTMENQTVAARPAQENSSSPMFVKAKPERESPPTKVPLTGDLGSASQKKPRFVKHGNDIGQKPIDIQRRQDEASSGSPQRRSKQQEEDEINQQLKEI